MHLGRQNQFSMKICNFANENYKMKKQINTIVFIGAGNVSTRLALAFKESSKAVLQVYSRTEDRAKVLADKLGAGFTTDFSELNLDADLYVLSVPDNALEKIVEKLDLKNQLIVHTSGTSPMNVLNKFNNFGIFYPLQTFSVEKDVSFKNIPICLEANSDENLEMLTDLAKVISATVQQINSEQRKVMHVAAVFANNFTNYMYAVAEDILSDSDLSFDLLKPLIEETAAKLKAHNPHDSQTGPASRNDQKVIEKHLEILKEHPEHQEIYKLLSEQIKRKHHKNDKL